MARNPRIPYRAFGEGRLPAALRQRFQHRASNYAHRLYDDQIAALRARRTGIRRQYQRDLNSAQGAINFTQNAIQQVPLKGLHGRYRQEVAAEIAQSSSDVAKSFPALKAEARAVRRDSMTELQDKILGARIERQQTAARTLNSLLGEARTDAESYLKSKKDAEGTKKETKTALYLARNALTLAKKKPWEFKTPEQQKQAWAIIAEEAAGEGVSPLVAQRAVAFLQQKHTSPLDPVGEFLKRTFGG